MDGIEKAQFAAPQSVVPSNSELVLQNEKLLEISAEQDVPQLLEYWNLILKRRWTVIACLLVVFTTVAIGTLKQKPVYEGQVVIEINPEETPFSDDVTFSLRGTSAEILPQLVA